MDADIIKTGVRLTPWGDESRHAQVLNRAVVEQLKDALSGVGAQVIRELSWPSPLAAHGDGAADAERDDGALDESGALTSERAPGGRGERLIVTDDLWVSEHLMGAFVAAARKAEGPSILAFEVGLFTEFSATLQDLGRAQVGEREVCLYPLVYVPPGASWSPKRGRDLALSPDGLEPVVVEQDPHVLEMPMHPAFTPEGKLTLPMTHLAAVRVSHWMHIVRANQLGLLAWGRSLFKVTPWRLLWAVVKAMSFNFWRIQQKLVVQGRGCDIHPSAVVEASTLGDNVKVGANAVVRYSHLGDGVRISDQCNILYSVLGEGASVSRMGMLQSCVLYPGSLTGHYGLQLCVVGRDTFVGGEVVLGDFKPRGEIMVMHRGRLVSSGTNMMGCAVGHGCQVLMRATTWAGREIPNGYEILGPPHDIIAKIPEGLPRGEPLVSDGGVLVPYEALMGGRDKGGQ